MKINSNTVLLSVKLSEDHILINYILLTKRQYCTSVPSNI